MPDHSGNKMSQLKVTHSLALVAILVVILDQEQLAHSEMVISDVHNCVAGKILTVVEPGVSMRSENDKSCGGACKQTDDKLRYKKGNWALMRRDHLECCCGLRRNPIQLVTFSKDAYQERLPVLSREIMDKLERGEETWAMPGLVS